MREEWEYDALERKLGETKKGYQAVLIALVGVLGFSVVRCTNQEFKRMEGLESITGAEIYDTNGDGVEDICLITDDEKNLSLLGDGKGNYGRQK